MTEMITLQGINSLRAMSAGQAIRDEEDTVRLHASTAFDATQLSSTTRRVLRLADVKISASGTINGLTVDKVDELLAKAGTTSPLTTQQCVAIKLELRAKGILYRPRA